MEVLAPHALTIAHDQDWLQWRTFHEAVLCPGSPHPDQSDHLPTIRAAFSAPCHSLDDIRQRLGVTMLAVVFGVGRESTALKGLDLTALAEDVQQLADMVNQPLRRLLLGSFQKSRRELIYAVLGKAWEASTEDAPKGSLLSRAHAANLGDSGWQELLEQLPHWMFTFQGSASKLFGRTLVILLSRPELLEKVREELRMVCASDGPRSEDQIARLTFLEACVLETGRLYPPVQLTVHRRDTEEIHDGRRVPANTDILQLFLLLQRPQKPYVEASEFQPSLWLDRTGACPFSDVFLSGARSCPGKDLILFVIKAGLATILAGDLPTVPHGAFRQARWPLSFPDRLIRFTASPSTS
jgi:cytochrome P450